MERSVSMIRDRFFRDLIIEYMNQGERSFLYRYFWADSVSGLLEEYLPELSGKRSPQLKDEPEIRNRLAWALKKNPEQARGRLLKEVSGGSRRDFWEELWLNDAGYLAGLISDTDYYFWLVKYLAKRGIYYKDTSMWDQRKELNFLLRKGLRDRKRTSESDCSECKSSNGKEEIPFTTAQLKRDLADLAEKLRRERETGGTEITNRLKGLKYRVRTKKGTRQADYLPLFTSRLARMALHIQIKTWLQDSGYPLIKRAGRDKAGKEPFTTGPRRKRDFSMGLFEAYCDSPQGYEFHKKNLAGAAVAKGWSVDSAGFCRLDPDQIYALQNALKESGEMPLSIPLAVDLYSGCVFFLAGKALYEEVYRREEEKRDEARESAEEACEDARKNKEEYVRYAREHRMQQDSGRMEILEENLADAKRDSKTAKEEYIRIWKAQKEFKDTKSLFCFDYLRLDEEHLMDFEGDVQGALRLGPHFHENTGKSYEDILIEFQEYCIGREDGPRALVREYNRNRPAGIRDTDMFRWAFDDQ